MKRLLALLVVAAFAAPAAAQGPPWYARGQFNNWPAAGDTSNELTLVSGNHYSTTVTGLFDSTDFEFKIASLNWDTASPGGNGKVTSNAAGEITFHLYDQTTWADGWFPNSQRRVGYNDPLLYGWELMGSFDGFSTGLPMVSQGNGVYSVQAALDAGVIDYKFRKAGSWDINYGNSFAHDSGNNQIVVQASGDVWQFDLDLVNGRFKATSTTQHGDFNGDGNTDAADYVVWRDTMPANSAKYSEWRTNFGRAASWIAHGSFGADVTLTDQGNGNFGTSLTGLTAGTAYDVQVLRSDGGASFPGSAAKIAADANGNINLHFYKLQSATWADGWSPANASRVGYDDPHQYGWEIVGAFNGWPGANDPAFQLTDQGNGLYTGSFAMAAAGTFEWKFRHLAAENPWSTSIGDNFGNSAGNNSFTVANAGDIWNFQLDLVNGRWRAFHPGAGLGTAAVPEPASAMLLMLGAVVGLGLRRR